MVTASSILKAELASSLLYVVSDQTHPRYFEGLDGVIPHVAYFLGDIDPGEIEAEIRTAINKNGRWQCGGLGIEAYADDQ